MVDVDYSSLSNKDLSDMLKEYGVTVGPINVATRSVYERKLHKLKTGDEPSSPNAYEPVSDDDDDVVQFKSTKASYRSPTPPKVTQRKLPAETYTPLIDSRPSLNSAKKTTLSYEPRISQMASDDTEVQQSSGGGGLPLWVKLSALGVMVVLVYLIYVNMESNTSTNIPKIPRKMEV